MRRRGGDHQQHRPDLDQHDHGVETRAPFDAQRQQAGDAQTAEHREKIDAKPFASARRALRPDGKLDSEQPQQRLEITGPADRHDRDDQRIFEQQIPADDPGDEFAKHRVSIGVGAAGDWNHRGEFGVAQGGRAAGDAGDDEGQ